MRIAPHTWLTAGWSGLATLALATAAFADVSPEPPKADPAASFGMVGIVVVAVVVVVGAVIMFLRRRKA
jgi:hypothetical protein